MTRQNPYTQRQIERAIRAAHNCGLHVIGQDDDGTVFLSEMPPPRPKPALVAAPETRDPRARSMAEGLIYFISDGKFIKIGYATDWRARRAALQIANPRHLVLLLVYEGGQPLERQLHRRFVAHRVRGEWFRPSREILRHIKENRHRCVLCAEASA